MALYRGGATATVKRAAVAASALYQGGGVDPNAWKTAESFGVRLFSQVEVAQREAAFGVPVKGLVLFAETGQAATTWDQNVAIAQAWDPQFDFHKGGDHYFEYAIPLATGTAANPVQTLQEFADGVYNNQARQILTIIAQRDSSPVLRARPGWEGDGLNAFPHKYNGSALSMIYQAAVRQFITLMREVDPRFQPIFVLSGTITKWDPSFDWRSGDPGPGWFVGIGVDPYHVPTYNSFDGGREWYNLLQGPEGIQAKYQYGMDRDWVFAIPEHGSSVNQRGWERGIGKFCFNRKIAYKHRWERPDTGRPEWNVILSDGSKPIALDEARRWDGPLSITTPDTISVQSGVPISIPLDATAVCNWEISGPAVSLFTLSARGDYNNGDLDCTLPEGSYQITVRATNKSKVATKTHTITAAPAASFPAPAAGKVFMRGIKGAMARNSDHTYITGRLAA